LILLTVGQVNCSLGLLKALLAEMIVGVKLESCLIGLKGFVVLFEEEVAVSFFVIGLNEIRVFF
jgi:hypothetical protein